MIDECVQIKKTETEASQVTKKTWI